MDDVHQDLPSQDHPPEQTKFPLPFPELNRDLPLLLARMVNKYKYCPRLAYLEWVQGEWEDSRDTVEGRYIYRRVDKPGGKLPAPREAEEPEPIHARSITPFVQSARAHRQDGLGRGRPLNSGRLQARQMPVRAARCLRAGTCPALCPGHDPERARLSLRTGLLYYAASREWVPVLFDEELHRTTPSTACA